MGQNDRREDYVRARLEVRPDGALVATPFERQDSSMLRLLAQADALIVRPPHAPPATVGAEVEMLRLDGGGDLNKRYAGLTNRREPS